MKALVRFRFAFTPTTALAVTPVARPALVTWTREHFGLHLSALWTGTFLSTCHSHCNSIQSRKHKSHIRIQIRYQLTFHKLNSCTQKLSFLLSCGCGCAEEGVVADPSFSLSLSSLYISWSGGGIPWWGWMHCMDGVSITHVSPIFECSKGMIRAAT